MIYRKDVGRGEIVAALASLIERYARERVMISVSFISAERSAARTAVAND